MLRPTETKCMIAIYNICFPKANCVIGLAQTFVANSFMFVVGSHVIAMSIVVGQKVIRFACTANDGEHDIVTWRYNIKDHMSEQEVTDLGFFDERPLCPQCWPQRIMHTMTIDIYVDINHTQEYSFEGASPSTPIMSAPIVRRRLRGKQTPVTRCMFLPPVGTPPKTYNPWPVRLSE